jgi:hypothetical protein
MQALGIRTLYTPYSALIFPLAADFEKRKATPPSNDGKPVAVG